MAGIIPRNAKTLKVTFKIETSAHKVGDVAIIQKNMWNYWSDGKYQYLVGMLRNKDICKVEVIN